ncbi:hypothetical protein ACWOFR_11965 [Carnobacterium gallinarum]|uniref:hypothetical protein n=1 Tax=Carnobacterium gallinarum TaxID=2749 RepID=UPI0005586D0D|nr:hypothetical protein [Carnobacterium gallinarum]
MRQRNPIWVYVLAAVGFMALFSVVASVFGAILFLVLKILIPIALIVWLINFIGRSLNGRRQM